MKITIRSESIVIEGYVNAVERNSKPLMERGVKFIERIGQGAFARAITRALTGSKDIRVLLNHNWDKNLGGIKDGTLELTEDNIGLKARAVVTDPEVIEDAKNGDLIGWSFGFEDVPDGVTQLRDEESGLPIRKVNDLVLREVSILNRKKSPAYVGTLISVRDDGSEERTLISDEYSDDIETVDESIKEAIAEIREETPEEDKSSETKELSSETLARYKNIISELKSLVKD